MNPFETKVFMLRSGLTIASIARDLCKEYPEVKFTSMQTMVSDLIHGRKWFPEYAKRLNKLYKIEINQAERKSNKEIIKQAA